MIHFIPAYERHSVAKEAFPKGTFSSFDSVLQGIMQMPQRPPLKGLAFQSKWQSNAILRTANK